MQSLEVFVGVRHPIYPANILYLKSYINYTEVFYTDGRRVVVATTLKTFERCFAKQGFCRVHRSVLVNMAFVKAFGEGEVYIDNDHILPVSRRKGQKLKKKM